MKSSKKCKKEKVSNQIKKKLVSRLIVPTNLSLEILENHVLVKYDRITYIGQIIIYGKDGEYENSIIEETMNNY